MVCVNTYYTKIKIQFKHFVEVPSADCVIGTAHDDSKKIKIFLIVNGSGPIYKRNGLNNTWDQLDINSEHYETIRKLVTEGLNNSDIPHYSTNSLSILN